MKVRVISVYLVRLSSIIIYVGVCFWNLIYMRKYCVQNSLFSDRDKLLNSGLTMTATLRVLINTLIKLNKFIVALIYVFKFIRVNYIITLHLITLAILK